MSIDDAEVTTEVLIDSGVFGSYTGYGLDRTYLVTIEVPFEGARTEKVRVRVRRDIFDRQTYFTAHVWRSEGWTEVVSIDDEHTSVDTLPPPEVFETGKAWRGLADGRAAAEEAVEALAKQLLNSALLVLL